MKLRRIHSFLTYHSEQTMVASMVTSTLNTTTLSRGMYANGTTCESTCEYFNALITLGNGFMAIFAPGTGMIIKYFRCYSFENGNNENSDKLPKTWSDVQCNAVAGLFSLLLFSIFFSIFHSISSSISNKIIFQNFL